jgi:hypothetical protein
LYILKGFRPGHNEVEGGVLMKKTIFISISFIFITSLIVSIANAGTKETAGKATMAYTKKEVVPIGDTEGHIIMLGVSNGLSTNTSNWDFMDGATATTRSTADLIKGNGPQIGYFTLSKEGNETVAKFSGTIKTVLSKEKKPITSFSGEWKYIKCAGEYEGCSGEGTYKGHFISEGAYIVEYQGTITLQ